MKPKAKKKKKRSKSIGTLLNECANLVQKYVRLKACDSNLYVTCVTCGKRGHYKEMDGGHFISRKYVATKLLEENIHPQCKYCNLHLRGNLIRYTLYMQEMYGKDFINELERMKNEGRKWMRYEVEELIEDYKNKIRGLEDAANNKTRPV